MAKRIFKTGPLSQTQLQSVFTKLTKWKIEYDYYERLKLIAINFSGFGTGNPNGSVLVDFFESNGCSLNGEEMKKARIRIMAHDAMKDENANVANAPKQKLKEFLIPAIRSIITEYKQ